ncbi:MAG: hypothetical protein ACP5C3_09615 [Methanomicrobiales archaeon]
MNQKNTGIIVMVLAILLAIIYLAVPALLLYAYWIAVILLFVYGLYSYFRGS